MIYFIEGFSIFLGILGLLVKFFTDLGLGIFSTIFGFVFLGLAYLVQSQGSKIALAIALGLFILDTILSALVAPSGGLIVRAFFIYAMF